MINYFLHNRLSGFMLSAALVIAGVLYLPALPVSLMPSGEYPALSVIIEYPGVDPDRIELLITRPVERAVKTVSGIKEIQSVSEEGKSRVNLSFNEGTDIKIAAVHIREKLGLITDFFPGEVQPPLVLRFDPTERPVVIAAADMEGSSRNEIREYLDRRIKPSLQRIEGISEVNIAGGQVREIHIKADRSVIEGGYLSPGEIASSVSRGNISIPGGVVESEGGNRVLYIPSGFRSLTEIMNTPLFSEDNRVSRVRDFATVDYGFREREDLSRYAGEEYVTLYVHSAGGANTLRVCNEAIEMLSLFTDVDFKIIYNQGEYIGSAVRNAALSGLWGVIIVFVLLSLFFRKKEAVFPIALSIPVSMIIVPVFLFWGGRGINIMSLSGFALAAGMVVDNGIVVIERIRSTGATDITGVLEAVNSVKSAAAASTVTTISIFTPLIFFSSSAAGTYGDMAYTVTFALLVSLFIALIIVPAVYFSISIRSTGQKNIFRSEYANLIKKVEAGVTVFEKIIFEIYRKSLEQIFRRRNRFLNTAGIMFFVSLIIFSTLQSDAVSDRGGKEFYAYLEFPAGSSLLYTDRGVSRVEGIAAAWEDVERVSSKTEKWRGTLTVRVKSGTGQYRINRIKERLKQEGDEILAPMGGFVHLSDAGDIPAGEITIHFTGNDYATLRKIAERASSFIKDIPGMNECLLRFREGRPRYTLVVDREKSGAGGVTHSAIADNVRSGLFGPVISKFVEDDREVDIRFRYRERDSIEEIMSGSVKSRDGALIRISELVAAVEGTGPTRNYRLNGRKSVSITAKTGGMSLQEAVREIQRVLDKMGFPEEYGYEFDGKVKEFRENRRDLAIAVAVSVIIIFMLLASLFESLTLPFVIMITLPTALTGVAPVLALFSVPISPPVYMGLIVLSGIVVNNGIILIYSVNRQFREGILNRENLREKIFNIACSRFRPVVITVCTTVIGMLPLLVSPGDGSALWRPFALTVTAGLLSSTLFTLGALPLAAYKYYEKKLMHSGKAGNFINN